MPRGAVLTPEKKQKIAKLLEKGATTKQVAKKLDVSVDSVWRVNRQMKPLEESELKFVAERLRGRWLLATDELLESALVEAKKASPYQRMIMAGIAHDHYLRTLMFERGQQSDGVLAKILIMVDARERGAVNPFTGPDVPSTTTTKVIEVRANG